MRGVGGYIYASGILSLRAAPTGGCPFDKTPSQKCLLVLAQPAGGGQVSLLVPGFKSSIRLRGPAVCDPAKGIGSDGKFRFAGNFDPAAPVSAKPLFSRGEDGIFNQNAVFEMASNKNTCNLYRIKGSLIWQSGFFRTASE